VLRKLALVFEEQEVANIAAANMSAAAAPLFDTVTDINSPVTVPDNDSARLMYYLDCKYCFPELS